MATWVFTGDLTNFQINVERGFDVIGFKERRRNQAMEFEPGDEVVFYVTGVQAFGGIARVRSRRSSSDGAGASRRFIRGRLAPVPISPKRWACH